jgi:DNA mismatch repair protein MutL
MVVVDMHAAHERILYEQLKNTLDAQQSMPSQTLLVPQLVAIDPRLAQEIEQGQPLWQRFGFDLSLLNPQQVAVRAVPTALAGSDVASLLQEWLADVQAYGVAHVLEQQRNAWLAGVACRAAVRANCALSVPEMNTLLRAMETTARADQCNHGRPTWRVFSWAEMDAWFLRGQ